MRFSWRFLLTLFLIGAAGLLAFIPGPARAVGDNAGESEPAVRPPARWRDDPELHRRLIGEWQAFRKLPADRQARIRRLDEEINDEPPAARGHLWAVLDRYTAWLDHLDPQDREQIEAEADSTKKLDIIRKLRERDWLGHLSRAERDRINQAPPEERGHLIEQLRQAERQRRTAWQAALRNQGDIIAPRNPPAFWPAIRLYEAKSLMPTLKETDRQGLQKAMRSSWPEHAQMLTALAERHSILVPPSEHAGMVAPRDLPQGYMQTLLGKMRPREAAKTRDELRKLAGRWPQFALEVDRLARSRKVPRPEKPLGPCKSKEFMPAVQKFIEDLRKDPAAARRLDEARGNWPDYPFAVMELAKQRNKRVPGTSLPGNKDFWEKAKAAQAE